MYRRLGFRETKGTRQRAALLCEPRRLRGCGGGGGCICVGVGGGRRGRRRCGPEGVPAGFAVHAVSERVVRRGHQPELAAQLIALALDGAQRLVGRRRLLVVVRRGARLIGLVPSRKQALCHDVVQPERLGEQVEHGAELFRRGAPGGRLALLLVGGVLFRELAQERPG